MKLHVLSSAEKDLTIVDVTNANFATVLVELFEERGIPYMDEELVGAVRCILLGLGWQSKVYLPENKVINYVFDMEDGDERWAAIGFPSLSEKGKAIGLAQ